MPHIGQVKENSLFMIVPFVKNSTITRATRSAEALFDENRILVQPETHPDNGVAEQSGITAFVSIVPQSRSDFKN